MKSLNPQKRPRVSPGSSLAGPACQAMRTAAPPGPDPWDPARAVWSPTASGHLLRACSLPGPSTLQLRQLWPWVEAHRALGAPLGIDGTGACPSATMRGSSRAPGPPHHRLRAEFNGVGPFHMGRPWAAPPWLRGPHGPPPSPHPFCCDPSCLPHASGTEALWSALAGQRCPGRQSSNAHKPQPTPGTCADTRVHRAPGQTLSRTHTHSCARTRPESLPLSACDQTWCECGAQCLEKAPSTVEPRVTGEAGASVAGTTAVS